MGEQTELNVCVCLFYVCWQQIPSILCSQTVLLLVLRTGLGCIWLHCTGNKIGEAVNHIFILPALSALRLRARRPGTDGFSILPTLQKCYLPWIKDINAVNIVCMRACIPYLSLKRLHICFKHCSFGQCLFERDFNLSSCTALND